MTELRTDTTRDTDGDRTRPPIWAGHIGPLFVNDIERSITFYRTLGLRPAARTDALVSMEMRGGTHLVLRPVHGTDDPVEPVDAPFDLMTDDLVASRSAIIAAGYEATDIEASGNHHRFIVTDPTGHRIRIHNSHVVGVV